MPPFLSTLFGGDASASHDSQQAADIDASPSAELTVEGQHTDGSGTSHSYSEHVEAGANVSTSAVIEEGDSHV